NLDRRYLRFIEDRPEFNLRSKRTCERRLEDYVLPRLEAAIIKEIEANTALQQVNEAESVRNASAATDPSVEQITPGLPTAAVNPRDPDRRSARQKEPIEPAISLLQNWPAPAAATSLNAAVVTNEDRSLRDLIDGLAESVQRENAVLRHLLTGFDELPVGLDYLQGEVHRPDSRWSPSSESDRLNGTGVVELAERFQAGEIGQLTVLGEAGAGKTTMLVLLVDHLLVARGPDDRIPIRFPLASWNPAKIDLYNWMARRFQFEYPELAALLGKLDDARILEYFMDRWVLPILDGMDEIPAKIREEAGGVLADIFGFLRPVIITSRVAEYDTLERKPLPRAELARIRPLRVDQIRASFSRAGRPAWAEALEGVEDNDSPLVAALNSPLMVWLACKASDETSGILKIGEVSFTSDHSRIKRQLLTAFVPTVFERALSKHGGETAMLRSDPDDAIRWLTFFARQLQRNERREIAWWQITELAPSKRLAIFSGAAAGVLLGLVGRWTPSIPIAVGLSLVFGLFFGVCFGRGYSASRARVSHLYRFAFSGDLRDNDPEFLIHAQRLGIGLVSVFSLAASSSGIYWVIWGDRPPALTDDVVVRVLTGLGIGVVVSALVGLLGGVAAGVVLIGSSKFDKKVSGARASSPREAIKRDGMGAAAGTAILGALICALLTTATIQSALHQGTSAGVLSGIAGGLTSSLLFAAWVRFRVAHLWLVIATKLPLRLVGFLEEAHELGVLRQTAISYEFRHDLLQRSLAGLATDRR
ncbi:hypothetical protein, partial [Parafrankia sp. FMc2]|uniref:hypothetical protein n=1 Tax=Parafrankia sp. FMc2 TaxID=3233196 RepID=UPI0034D39C02